MFYIWQVNKITIINVSLFKTHSVTPSDLSAVSDLTSSLPGVLAGCGTAGECLSEIGVVGVTVVTPGAVVVSLAGSSTGAGEGWGWGWEGLGAVGWGLASDAGWASDGEGLAAVGLAASLMAGGVAAAGELGELELPPLAWSYKDRKRSFKVKAFMNFSP